MLFLWQLRHAFFRTSSSVADDFVGVAPEGPVHSLLFRRTCGRRWFWLRNGWGSLILARKDAKGAKNSMADTAISGGWRLLPAMRLGSIYACEELDGTPTAQGITVTGKGAGCIGLAGQRREFRLKPCLFLDFRSGRRRARGHSLWPGGNIATRA